MKHIFILDENVFIQSHTCKDIQGSTDDYNSLHLILKILRNCHKIGLTNELAERYRDKCKVLEKKKKINSASIRIWKYLLSTSGKHRFCDSQLKDLPSNLEHDRHVIEPTIFLSGILITTDEKLKLTKWAEDRGFELSIMSPSEALVVLEL